MEAAELGAAEAEFLAAHAVKGRRRKPVAGAKGDAELSVDDRKMRALQVLDFHLLKSLGLYPFVPNVNASTIAGYKIVQHKEGKSEKRVNAQRESKAKFQSAVNSLSADIADEVMKALRFTVASHIQVDHYAKEKPAVFIQRKQEAIDKVLRELLPAEPKEKPKQEQEQAKPLEKQDPKVAGAKGAEKRVRSKVRLVVNVKPNGKKRLQLSPRLPRGWKMLPSNNPTQCIWEGGAANVNKLRTQVKVDLQNLQKRGTVAGFKTRVMS